MTTIAEGGGAARANTGGKGWQGDDDNDNCGRGCRVFVLIYALPHAMKFQDLQHQTAMPEPSLHDKEVWREDKTMQNINCSYPRQEDLQVLP